MYNRQLKEYMNMFVTNFKRQIIEVNSILEGE